jgi:tetratricopeptide (TPR) repeat protein
VRHPALFSARGTCFWHLGLYDTALRDFEAALELAPRNPVLWNAVAECLMKLGEWKSAGAAYDSALAGAPRLVQTHYRRGVALQMNGQRQAAQAAHRRALELKPDHAGALASLALIAASEGNPEKVAQFAGLALALDGSQPTAQIALAASEFRRGDLDGAGERTRTVLQQARFGEDPRANEVLRELADGFDLVGRPTFAFTLYSAVNRKRREIHGRRFAHTRSSREVCGLLSWFERSRHWERSVGSPRTEAETSGHVFVLGFARSGTTLIEAILARHPQVVALDERDCFSDQAKALLSSAAGIERLSVLGPDEIGPLRDSYWEKVRSCCGPTAGRVFVDKWPFNSRRLALIARLFPDAGVLFAVRDPRDVVLSCFRRSFVMNSDTFEFLTLDDCARYYSQVMELAKHSRDKLPLQLRAVRYEDLVGDFDATVRAICDFVGIGWNDGMRDFGGAADGTLEPRAQSRRQIRMGLYTGAAGRWRRYAEQLAPVLPILHPWIEHFGYAPD